MYCNELLLSMKLHVYWINVGIHCIPSIVLYNCCSRLGMHSGSCCVALRHCLCLDEMNPHTSIAATFQTHKFQGCCYY